jgi:DNA polymerase
MCNRKKVLSAKNGNLNSKVLFIAEAPGRLGAERTNTPLYGDKTGDNFEKLLGSIGWKRDDVFITNSVLCNPQKNSRNNRSVNAQPNCEELKNCNEYLEKTIKIINPDVIITLGE